MRKVAAVTGAASGFGLALARQCVARGMDVALFDRAVDEVHAVAAALRSEGAGALSRRVDVSSMADLDEAAAATRTTFGRVDLVFANVGVQHFGAVESIEDDVWRWLLDVNVTGAARTARAFLPLLRETGGGRLAFTASANVLAPAARLGAYQASKGALVALAETLRLECSEQGVQVCVIHPSGMPTRHLESSAAARPAGLGGGQVSEEDLRAMLASRPMTDADLAAPEVAAARAVDGVLNGERTIITHGALEAAVHSRHSEITSALAALAARTGAAGNMSS